MKYTLKKIGIVLFCSVFILIGLGMLATNFIVQFNLLLLIIGTTFFLGGLFTMVTQLRQLSRFQKMTYLWYKQTYPAQVSGHQVSCFECGNQRIQVRALMRQTYHREHFCTQCGKTLYYSPEQK